MATQDVEVELDESGVNFTAKSVEFRSIPNYIIDGCFFNSKEEAITHGVFKNVLYSHFLTNFLKTLDQDPNKQISVASFFALNRLEIIRLLTSMDDK